MMTMFNGGGRSGGCCHVLKCHLGSLFHFSYNILAIRKKTRYTCNHVMFFKKKNK